MQEQTSSIDLALLGATLRERGRLIGAVGLLVWVALVVVGLCVVPRTYTATESVALQQSSGGSMGALAGLAGLGAQEHNYQGVIASRRFAAIGARAAHIQELYGLKTDLLATQLVQKAVTLENRQDGLLYINASLPAPPKLAPDPDHRAARVPVAAQTIAQAYGQNLNLYLQTSNTNRDADLIREARKQLKIARAAYEAAVQNLYRYLVSHPLSAGDASTGGSSGGSSSAGGASSGTAGKGGSGSAQVIGSELASLYQTKGQLEADIVSREATQRAQVGIVTGSVKNLTSLPEEDPLLISARAEVTRDAAALANLRIVMGVDNPQVVVARQRLAQAQARLRAESRAMAEGRTSEGIALTAMKARYAAVVQQITFAEQQARRSQKTALQYEIHRNEVELRLEALKTTATQYAALSVQKLAGNSQMDVIDEPLVPTQSKPGGVVIAAMSFFVTLLLLQAWLALEYYRRHRRAAQVRSSVLEGTPSW